MEKKLIARNRECSMLRDCMESDRSEFVIVYGRRRVGKTFLIDQYFKMDYDFSFVGSHRSMQRVQLRNFGKAMKQYAGLKTVPKYADWFDAFDALEEHLSNLPANRKKVVFFDEMPWIDTQKSDFVSELEYFWANWVQNRDDIVFIACGSATTWMKEKLEDNKGGLHNRITHRIYLRPFYLSECKEYLLSNGFEWDEYQIMQYYMVFGGVPYYLSLLRPKLSLVENIDSLIFRRGGALSDEFKELYNALFKTADKYIRIVQLLSTKREGFTKADISAQTGFSGGGLTKILENLERCDFIVSYAQYGNKTKLTLYRLCDFYTLFYFRYVKDNNSKDEQYWQHHFQDRSVESWEGFSFEEICLRHLPHLKQGLGISGMATEASSWRFVPKKDDERKGAQVDLVISRADKMIHLCEMKFSETPYIITKSYAERIVQRKQLFMAENGISRGTVLTFVTPNGLQPGTHNSIVHSSLTSKDLFLSLP